MNAPTYSSQLVPGEDINPRKSCNTFVPSLLQSVRNFALALENVHAKNTRLTGDASSSTRLATTVSFDAFSVNPSLKSVWDAP